MKKALWFIFGLIVLLIIIVLLLILYKPLGPDTFPRIYLCQTDADCIPLSSQCHPKVCMNKQYEDMFQKPHACTMYVDPEAAYNPEDCLCQDNVCVNKNLGRESQ